MTPEQQARLSIDALQQQEGWHVCSVADANIHAAWGVALREFPLNSGFAFAEYLLCIDGKTAGVIEAKKEGATLTSVEMQSRPPRPWPARTLPVWRRPLGRRRCHPPILKHSSNSERDLIYKKGVKE